MAAKKKVLITGAAGLVGGVLREGLRDGYDLTGVDVKPVAGFDSLAADTVTGTFSSVSLPDLEPLLAWHLGYNPDSIELTVTAIGDFDGDGIVGISDFLIVLGNWGPCPAPCPPCMGDADGDCQVGLKDFLVVLGNWS